MKLSFIIPAYNEENRIMYTLTHYAAAFPSAEFIVVADGTDRTADIARSFGVRVITSQQRLGKGGAVLKGMRAAQGDVIGYFDADGAVPVSDIRLMLAVLGYADVVIGSRRISGSRIYGHRPALYRLFSRGFNLWVNAMFRLGIRDTQCGAKLFTARALKTILPQLRTSGFEFDVELLWRAKQAGFKIIEVPVQWRCTPSSKFSLRAAPSMAKNLLQLRLGKI